MTRRMTNKKKESIREFNADFLAELGERKITITKVAKDLGYHSAEPLREIGRKDCLTKIKVDLICDYFGWDRKEHIDNYAYSLLDKGHMPKYIENDIASEVNKAPADIELQLDIPSFEEVETEETINESDELITKGMLRDMLKDYVRDLLMACLEGIV